MQSWRAARKKRYKVDNNTGRRKKGKNETKRTSNPINFLGSEKKKESGNRLLWGRHMRRPFRGKLFRGKRGADLISNSNY